MTEDGVLKELCRRYLGSECESIVRLPGSGSGRRYYRLLAQGRGLIGVANDDLKENRAFLSFSRSFKASGLPVPDIYNESSDGRCYLQQDLGDETLYSRLTSERAKMEEGKSKEFPSGILQTYREVLHWLPRFQLQGDPDYALCYPRAAFDNQSMHWDLSYFKYYYLKLSGIPFDEQLLEDDFHRLIALLLEAPADYFMYRDFQSRNVMVVDEQPWFIDYQGGRRGPLQYDLVSMLYDAKADLPDPVRRELLEYYLQELSGLKPVDTGEFLRLYPAFKLIRILQAMGAYGFRGYYEKKSHFLQSIPYALKNLSSLMKDPFLSKMPELQSVIHRMVETPLPGIVQLQPASQSVQSPAKVVNSGEAGQPTLTVVIRSFSFKKGYPEDGTEHGGGYIFDCRALPNPGRYEEYRNVTGKDEVVASFLSKEPAVDRFLGSVYALSGQSVSAYLERGFSRLSIGFGCTGGQHRSVYCAEMLARHLATRFNIRVELSHRELN